MTRPHGLVGKAYKWLLYALLIIALLVAMVVVAFGPFWIIAIIGAVIAAGFVGLAISWLMFRSQNYDGGG